MMISYIKALSNVFFKPLEVHQLPIHIQLEPTTFCNLNCKSCGRSKYHETPKHLSLEDFEHIITQIRPLKMTLSGWGEPFTNPHLLDMVGLARKYRCSINTTTNGTLLTPETCDQIVKSGLDLIKISLDGATPETYRKNRGEDRFVQVLDGIRSLIEARKRLGSATPFIRFNYVMSKDNYHEIANMVELAEKLGINAIYFQPLELTGIEERRDLLVGNLTYEKLLQEITRALVVSQQHHVRTNLQDIHKKLPLYWNKYQMQTHSHDPNRICIVPWFSAYITLEGMVRPCCSCSQDYTNMGNILQNDIEDIWNGEKYQHFRKAIREGKRPFAICANCVPQTLTDIIRYSRILPGFLR
jgi:radical SAM protein with 4Fe4S-binding SPASM domain